MLKIEDLKERTNNNLEEIIICDFGEENFGKTHVCDSLKFIWINNFIQDTIILKVCLQS